MAEVFNAWEARKGNRLHLPVVRFRPAPLQNPVLARLLPDAPLRFPFLPYMTKQLRHKAGVVFSARKGNRTLDLLITSELLYP